ncbi:MAG TPA: FliH/SctL family protein [Candidatus Cybelea sp.]
MREEFVPLSLALRPPPAPDITPDAAAAEPRREPECRALPDDQVAAEHAATFGALRRFRAALADALDIAVARLLAEIAENVLARELHLGAADVASIVAKARERFLRERIVAVRVHPYDREALEPLELQKITDSTLERGDVIAELHAGTIDLRLRARLEAAITASQP